MVKVQPSITLLSIIIFLLPGLAGVKLGLQIAERGDWFNRVDTVALSFGVSIVSMVVMYVCFSVLTVVLDPPLHFITVSGVVNRASTIPSVIFFYAVLVGFASLFGLLLGYLDFGRNRFESNLLWRRFFSIAEDSGDGETYAVRVRTSTGDELVGRVEDEGETTINRDVILENPRRIRYAEDGEADETYRWTGYAYVHDQNVAHVEFDRLEDADEAEVHEESESASTDDSDAEIEQLEQLADESEAK